MSITCKCQQCGATAVSTGQWYLSDPPAVVCRCYGCGWSAAIIQLTRTPRQEWELINGRPARDLEGETIAMIEALQRLRERDDSTPC